MFEICVSVIKKFTQIKLNFYEKLKFLFKLKGLQLQQQKIEYNWLSKFS
jgi:hypothetical protein